MKNPIIGKSVTGPDFIGRKNQINSILKNLEKSDILIQGARRFGKSSVMKELQLRLQTLGIKCVYGDFEAIKSELDFYIKLETLIESSDKWWRWKKRFRIYKPFMGWLRTIRCLIINLEEGITFFRDSDKVDGSEIEVFKKKICDIIHKNRGFIIIIDEFSVAISQIKEDEARRIIDWLSELKEDNPNVKLIIGGSVSTTRILAHLNKINFLNKFSDHIIEGYSSADAKMYIQYHIDDISPSIIRRICNHIGTPYIPFFLAVFIRQIQYRIEKRESLSDELIDDVYEKEMLGGVGREKFGSYADRLHQYDEYKRKLINVILSYLCMADKPIRVSTLQVYLADKMGHVDKTVFNNLLYDLEHEFYITVSPKKSEKMVLFKSKLLRDWWREFYAD